MPANFTSGWLGNGQAAWHGQGVVTEGTLPAREAFETADALFTVQKRELFYEVSHADETYDEGYGAAPIISSAPSGHFAVVRTDTQALLGVVSKQYEIVQNDSLLRMAEFIREEVDMDCVIVSIGWCQSLFYRHTPWCGDGHRPWRHRQTTHRWLPRPRRQNWLWCQVHQHPCCLSKHTDCRTG